jgi:hypothetical protein
MEKIKINEEEYIEETIFKNNYKNKIIINLCLISYVLFIILNIKYFPKNLIDKNQLRPYIKYINDCKYLKRYK